jgi:hypothetical protein
MDWQNDVASEYKKQTNMISFDCSGWCYNAYGTVFFRILKDYNREKEEKKLNKMLYKEITRN